MTRDKIFTGLSAWMLGAAISFGGVGCLVSAFGFENGSIPGLLLFCIVISLLWSVAFRFRFGTMIGWLSIGTLVIGDWLLGGGLLMQLRMSFEVLIHRISYRYHLGYGWGVIQWSEVLPDTSPDFALAILALLVSFVVVGTVSCRQTSLLAVPISVMPLGACLVLVDTIPHTGYLIILLAALVLLMMTTPLRRRNERQSNRLIAWLLLPVVLMSCLLFKAVPQEGYQPPDDFYLHFWNDWIQQGAGTVETMTSEVFPLTQLGNKSTDSQTVLTVTASWTGRLYLRSKSYDSYDGLEWTATANGNGVDNGWGKGQASTGGLSPSVVIPQRSRGNVTIVTEQALDFYFLPSPVYRAEKYQFQEGALPNPEKKQEYTFMWALESSGGTLYPLQWLQYISLPEGTAEALQDALPQYWWAETVDGSTEQKAKAVETLVRETAYYSLTPSKMPAGEEDFALWFLTEGESGYCAHFATTATVLLRALDVPARYVVGYVADVESKEPQEVPNNQAHAWVEYFIDGKGWEILDPTPGYGINANTTEPTQPTTSPTQPTTESTQPTTESTAPSTAPTEQTTQPSTQGSTGATAATGGADAPIAVQTRAEGFWWILYLLLALGAIWGQYRLRCWILKRRLGRGQPNGLALRYWRILNRRYRLLKEEMPSRLTDLAEKAKFSQHILSKEELAEFQEGMCRISQKVKEKPWLTQWLLRLVFAIE